jgi:hypothetical protein
LLWPDKLPFVFLCILRMIGAGKCPLPSHEHLRAR